jgi:hypothetical protein
LVAVALIASVGLPASSVAEPGIPVFMRFISGTDGPDVLQGSAERESIRGRGGADVLYGRGGTDLIRGNAGNDVIYLGPGRYRFFGAIEVEWQDAAIGGAGDDRIYGGTGADWLGGDDGNDRLYSGPRGERGWTSLSGGRGADVLVSGRGGTAPGEVAMDGNSGPDVLIGSPQEEQAYPGPGADRVRLNGGDDRVELFDDGQSDRVDCGAGNDTVYGTDVVHEDLDVFIDCETFLDEELVG